MHYILPWIGMALTIPAHSTAGVLASGAKAKSVEPGSAGTFSTAKSSAMSTASVDSQPQGLVGRLMSRKQ